MAPGRERKRAAGDTAATVGFEARLWRAADALRATGPRGRTYGAKLHVLVKRVLQKHGCPTDKHERSTQTVLEQTEVRSAACAPA